MNSFQGLQKDLELQKKKQLPVSSQQSASSASLPPLPQGPSSPLLPNPNSSPLPLPLSTASSEPQMSNNLDKQPPPRSVPAETSKSSMKPNISERPIAVAQKTLSGDKNQLNQQKALAASESDVIDKQKQANNNNQPSKDKATASPLTKPVETPSTPTSAGDVKDASTTSIGASPNTSPSQSGSIETSGSESTGNNNNKSKETSEKPLPGTVNIPGKGGSWRSWYQAMEILREK